MKKIGLIFGGISNEATISIESAKNIYNNFDIKKYQPLLVYWHKDGCFHLVKNFNNLNKPKSKVKLTIEKFKQYFNTAFLITHGKYGEDGSLQSILETQKIKYTGCRVLSSALCMDKGVFKNYLKGQGINQVKFEVIDYKLMSDTDINKKINYINKNLKNPLFVKPANSGSSVGVSKVKKTLDLNTAIKTALKHDHKIIIEEGLTGHREIEIAILGNKKLIISNPGELKPANEFYDYVDKYELNKTIITVPARLSTNLCKKIKLVAEKVYRLCDCNGFARIDFFLKNNQIYLNEINTLPGFTNISMFPRLMIKKGFSYKALINKIIELAY